MSDIISRLLTELADALEPGAAERCGVVLRDGSLTEIDNIHPEPTKGFHMCPKSFLLASSEAVATWHTHPGMDPNLSEEDMLGFLQWPELTHHIVGIRNGQPTVHSFAVIDGALVTL